MDEGYGLNDEALRRLADEGASLIVSVDCGIASVAEAETARELGLELIITDHHQMADRLPDALLVAHPLLPGHSYPFGSLCGAGDRLQAGVGGLPASQSRQACHRAVAEFSAAPP